MLRNKDELKRHTSVLNRLENIRKRTGMTEEGMNWLIAVTDPFHDGKLLWTGYPDRAVMPSVAMDRLQSTQLTNSGLKDLTKTWGYLAFVDDKLGSIANAFASRADNRVIFPGSNPSIFYSGGLTIIKFNMDFLSTFPCWYANPTGTTAADYSVSASMTIEQEYLKGISRQVFGGFEIHDVTPDLYKGGLITACEQPQAYQEKSAHIFAGNYTITPSPEDVKIAKSKGAGAAQFLVPVVRNGIGVRDLVISALPPNNAAECLLLDGAHQWNCERGGYFVQTMSDMSNPPRAPDASGDIYLKDETQIGITSGSSVNDYIDGYTEAPSFVSSIVTENGDTIAVPQFPANKRGVWNRKIALVTGLQPQAVHNINWKVGIERFPNQDEKQIVILAKPSPSEDYIAMQIYSDIVKHMPVACFVDDNDWGTWFSEIVDTVASVAQPIARGINFMADEWKQSRQKPQGQVESATPKVIEKIIVEKPKPKPKPKRNKKPTASRALNGQANRMKMPKLPALPATK